MKKIFLLLSLLLLSEQLYTQAYSVKILDADSCGIVNFKAFKIPNSNYKDLYIQYGRPIFSSSISQPRYWSWARYDRLLNNWFILPHNSFLHSFPFFCGWPNVNCYVYTNPTDFLKSPIDTSLIIQIREPAVCGYGILEPRQDTRITYNSGLTNDTLEQFSNDFIGNASFGFDIDPVNDSIMYFGYNLFPGKGFWKSTNRGTDWFITDTIQGFYSLRAPIKINPLRRNDIFVSGQNMYKSSNAGYNFYSLSVQGFSQMEFTNGILYGLGRDSGLYRSVNYGESWVLIKSGKFYSILVSEENNSIVYLGANEGLYRSSNRGRSFTLYNNNFYPSTKVIGIAKNLGSADTVIVSTDKAVYKVWGQEYYSADTSATRYYPLALGNIWVYHYTTSHSMPPHHMYRHIVDSLILVDGHIFYRIKILCKHVSGYPLCNGTTSYVYNRVDSTSGIIYQYVPGSGCLETPGYDKIDSLIARKGDTIILCGITDDPKTCADTSALTIFGLTKPHKKFTSEGFEFYSESKYAKDIGRILWVYCNAFICHTYELMGCVINGITYGDTTFMTGVNTMTTEVPRSYCLYQNYPNPFNPLTTIEFDIPRKEFASLSLHDITGRLTEVLYNGIVSPGRYSVSWDGSNYASGVYFYTLKTESFTQTKRMVLVK